VKDELIAMGRVVSRPPRPWLGLYTVEGSDGVSRLLRVPPGVAHGVKNVGLATGRIIYFVDEPFSAEPALCDEGRLPWDFAGDDVWDVARG